MKGKEARSLTDRLAKDLARTYSDYQAIIKNTLKPFATLKAKTSGIREAKSRIREIVRRLDIAAVRWSRAAVAEAYKSKRSEVSSIAKKANPFIKAARKEEGSGRLPKLISDTAEQLIKSNATIERTAYTFLDAYETALGGVEAARTREPAQFMAGDMSAEMSRKVSYYLARGYDEGSITRKLRTYLETLVAGDDFIEIGGRFYELKAYAELVARTELHNIYAEATIDECKKWDCDLVQFSRHDDPCPICGPLEGMVFSISGADEDFPSINDTVTVEVSTKNGSKSIQVDPKNPHPNCEHNLNPVTRNILREAGEL